MASGILSKADLRPDVSLSQLGINNADSPLTISEALRFDQFIRSIDMNEMNLNISSFPSPECFPSSPSKQEHSTKYFEKRIVEIDVPKLIKLRERAQEGYSTYDFRGVLNRFENYLSEEISDNIVTQAFTELTQHLPYLADSHDLQKKIWELIKDLAGSKKLASAEAGQVWLNIALYQTQSHHEQLKIEAMCLVSKHLTQITAHLKQWIQDLEKPSSEVSDSDITLLQQIFARLPTDKDTLKTWGEEMDKLEDMLSEVELDQIKFIAESHREPGTLQIAALIAVKALGGLRSRAEEIINQHQPNSSSADLQRIV